MQALTPNSRRVAFEQKNNIAYSENGSKECKELVPDTKDTRGSKKQRRNMNGSNMGSINRGISPLRVAAPGSTPAPKPAVGKSNGGPGFLSRGFAMFQAASRLSPKPPLNPNTAQTQPKTSTLMPTESEPQQTLSKGCEI